MDKKRITLEVPWPDLGQTWAFARKWLLPNPGTLLLMVVLALAVPAIAGPAQAPSATSTSTISYQGRLADSGGTPLTGKYNLEFRIYDVPSGGVPLWTEMWTGGNAVDVSDGLFNVMLGSIDNTLASSIEGYDELYLGITVGADGEMVPRVQLGSVPFSMHAMVAEQLADAPFASNNAEVSYSEEKDLDESQYLPFEGFEHTIEVSVPSQVFIVASACLNKVSGDGLLYADLRRNGEAFSPNTSRYVNPVPSWSQSTWNTVDVVEPGTYTYQMYVRGTTGIRMSWHRPQISILVVPIQ